MNIRKAILINIVLYIATYFVAAAILALQGMPLHGTTPPTGDQIFIAMVTGIVLTALGAWWFFRTEAGRWRAGFVFGLIAILVGFAMDAVISVGIWMSGANPLALLQTSYSYFFFGIMLSTVLVLTSAVGWIMGKK